MKLSGSAFIVIGMHRSGTSAVMNALECLGVFLGKPEELLEANEFNEEGFYELIDMIIANDFILANMGMSYDRVGPIPKNWRELPFVHGILNKMEAVLTQNFAGKPLWGYKDPRTTVLMPFHEELLGRLGAQPHWILCVRHPLSVMKSLAKREGLKENHSLALWLRYTLSGLKESIGKSRTVVLYEPFLEAPRKALEASVRAVPGWSPDEEAWSKACSVARPELSHSKYGEEALDGYPSIFKRTYELCRKASEAPDDYQAGKFDERIEALWGELETWTDMFREAEPPPGRLRLFWRQEGKLTHADCEYEPKGDWQTLRVTVTAAPGSLVGAALYHLPSSIWVRRANWLMNGKAVPANLRAGFNGQLQSEAGMPRLLVLPGPEDEVPEQLLFQAPDQPGPYEFEIEILVEVGFQVAVRCAKFLARQLSATAQRAAEMEMQLRRLAPGSGRVVPPGG